MKTNNWTKTFKNLLKKEEGRLNISISDGNEIETSYLSDVKLTKLDTLSRQMVVSLLPEEMNFIDNNLNY